MRPNLAMKAQATTKSATPRAMAKMRVKRVKSRWRTSRGGAAPSPLGEGWGEGGFATFRSAEGCATTTRLGSALISGHLHFEAAGVLHRVLAVPHDPVDELGRAHHVLGQVRLGSGRGLLVDLDLVHLLRHLEVVRVFLEQAPAAVLRHEPHAVGEVGEVHRAIVVERSE